jgi:hypothetical protein
MTPRHTGTIIKTPGGTPGLLIVEGQQKPFTLEGVWKSPVAPVVNMAVDLELDDAGFVKGLTALDPQEPRLMPKCVKCGAVLDEGQATCDVCGTRRFVPVVPGTQAVPAMQASEGTAWGVVSIVFGAIGLMPFVGIVSAIIGFCTGLIGRSKARRFGNPTGMTLGLIGIILSSITLVIALISLMFFGGVLALLFGAAAH